MREYLQLMMTLNYVWSITECGWKMKMYCIVLMVDIGFYAQVNEIYSEWLGDTIPPARAAYEVSKLPGGALIEIV